ncbi:MAG: MBL fold metallo-hydrolase [Persicimonas sp.]
MDESIKIRVLASGSSGNSLFVRIGETRILVDAGISCRRITRALAEMDESPEALSAVLLTHEHSDHTSGLAQVLQRWPQTPVFCTPGTLRGCEDRFDKPTHWTGFRADQPFRVGPLVVEPFELAHDANEPCGFRLQTDGFSMGIVTDLGVWSDQTVEAIRGCRVLLLEANHDLQMLRNGPYPAFLKRRIASRDGHLSNEQACALLSRVATPQLEWIILTHLSAKNNRPETAIEKVGAAAPAGARVIAAGPKPGEPIDLAPALCAATRPARQGILL